MWYQYEETTTKKTFFWLFMWNVDGSVILVTNAEPVQTIFILYPDFPDNSIQSQYISQSLK